MNRFSAVLLGLCFLFSGGALQAKPCGSDGPIPFLNMTGSITLPVKAIQSVGSVQEFTYWETQDALVYRNDSDQLRVSYFGSGVDTPLASLSFPLSKLVDPSESLDFGPAHSLLEGQARSAETFLGGERPLSHELGNSVLIRQPPL
jgi:hypothetical protein